MQRISIGDIDGTVRTPSSAIVDETGSGLPAKPPAASILVVDDDRASRLAMTAILAGIGDRIVCVESGREALRRLLQEDYAIILLDVLLSDISGYETAHLIRQRERSKHVPIIFMSAVNKDQRHMFQGYSAGAVDYVFKPVEPMVLRSKVSVFVDLHRTSVQLREKAESEKRLLTENLKVRTEQMRTVEALNQAAVQQSLIIEALPIAFYVASADGGFRQRRYVSGRTRPMFGFSAGCLERQSEIWFERIHDDDREDVRRSLDRLVDTGQFYAQYRWRCGDGIWRHFLDQGRIVPKDRGEPSEMFGTTLDVTERRALEQQLAHAQKMEVLGQLTSGIAHDFNNMLTVIFGGLECLQRLVEPGSRIARHSDMAMRGAMSCADLTRRLLGFARRHPLLPKPLDLNSEITRLWELFRRMLGTNMQIRHEAAEELWTVVADPMQIEAALVNLVVNARNAMTDNGHLTISTQNRAIDRETATAMGIAPGDYVELAVADTGSGMSLEIREQAFDPFFTTKQPGKGTGLGLSTIYGFIRQSNGGVTIESEIGQGTVIKLYLPRAQAANVVSERTDAPEPLPVDAKQKVLVVDDDGEVLNVAVALLENLGYAVVAAADGPAALALIESDPTISLLFTDLAMPGMDGHQLAAKSRELRPSLSILFTSGNAKEIPLAADNGSSIGFVPKPYRQHALDAALRAALAADKAR